MKEVCSRQLRSPPLTPADLHIKGCLYLGAHTVVVALAAGCGGKESEVPLQAAP